MRMKTAVAWSGGKDSALALHRLFDSPEYEVVTLLTTISEEYDRISMHGVRTSLLEEQAASVGLTIQKVLVPKECTNGIYESRMREAVQTLRSKGISVIAFGDIFLEDVRRYRERNLSRTGIEPVFPLWKEDTTKLARQFVDLGFKAIVTCVDSQALDKSFVGRDLDRMFLSDLPPSVDPCGENGEYHSFVYGGPIFKSGILFDIGETVFRNDRFYFIDLVPRGIT